MATPITAAVVQPAKKTATTTIANNSITSLSLSMIIFIDRRLTYKVTDLFKKEKNEKWIEKKIDSFVWYSDGSGGMSSTPSQSASQQTTMKIRSNAIENKSVGSSQLAKNTHTLKTLSQKMYEWPYLWAAWYVHLNSDWIHAHISTHYAISSRSTE